MTWLPPPFGMFRTADRDPETGMSVGDAEHVLAAEPGEYSREALLDARVTVNRDLLARRDASRDV